MRRTRLTTEAAATSFLAAVHPMQTESKPEMPFIIPTSRSASRCNLGTSRREFNQACRNGNLGGERKWGKGKSELSMGMISSYIMVRELGKLIWVV